MEPDINNNPDPNASIDYSNYTGPTAPAESPPPGQVQYNQSESTIQSATVEEMMANFLWLPQTPTLNPTSIEDVRAISALSVDGIYEKTKDDIISAIWKNFQRGVEDMEKLSKEAYVKKWVDDVLKGGPKSNAENYAFIMALSAGDRATEIEGNGGQGSQSVLAVQFKESFDQWIANPGKGASGDGRYPDPSFIAGAVASNPDALRAAIGGIGLVAGVEVTKQLSVDPLADALAGVGTVSGLPMDPQTAGEMGAAAMIAALQYTGAGAKATLETIDDAIKSGSPPQDIQFALNFANNIKAIVTHKFEGAALNPAREHVDQTIRLMLSVMALNLLYRRVFGGMEGRTEFTDLIHKGTANVLKDVNPAFKDQIQVAMDDLIAQIKLNLPKNDLARSDMIARLSKYIDSNDSVDSMLSTTRMFAYTLGERTEITERRIQGTIS